MYLANTFQTKDLNKKSSQITFAVGGNPFEVALGGEVARLLDAVRSLRLGGGCGDPDPPTPRPSCALITKYLINLHTFC